MQPIQSNFILANELTQELKGSLLGRHVIWLNKERSGWQKALVKLLMVAEAALATLSLVGIPLILKGVTCNRKVLNYKMVTSLQETHKPPPKEPIHLKSKLCSFNHVSDFCIHSGALWVRPRNDLKTDWQLLYFNRFARDSQPVEIQADGANLMVLDSQKVIHYKKVLVEKRTKDGSYSCQDISRKDNWTSAWYSFPLLRRFYHLFAPFRLKLPENTESWAISHRGKYNRYFEDSTGKKHPEFAMVTTIYVLPKERDKIYYADPYLTRGFRHTIDLPKSGFRADRLAASASTMLLMGKEKGRTVFYTRLADFDTLGKNPFLPGFYSKKAGSSREWVRQPEINLQGQATIGNEMTIFQCGEGNAGRTLRVEGTNTEGKKGYYEKGIAEPAWHFVIT